MAVTARLYTSAYRAAFNKEIDLDTDVIKVALCGGGYVPNVTTHDYFNDITNEVNGPGYTAGGTALTSKTVSVAGTTFTFDAADTTWATGTFTFRYAVIYDATPSTAATQPLIGYVDFGADVIASGTNVTIPWDALGIITLTAN